MLRAGPLLAALAGSILSSCALATPGGPPTPAATPARAHFDIARDAFAFPNLVRAERPGLNDDFANYCLIMARAASQFFRFARFAPAEPPASPAEYTRLTREVLARRPWDAPQAAAARVRIPGYPDLRTFSRAEEPAVKAAFGSNILSMLDWRLWRVSIDFPPAHQARVARELEGEVAAGRPVPVMITNFPNADVLNHAVLVYDYREESAVVEFFAYDPNDPGSPLSLFFDPGSRGFWIGPLTYSPPGHIRVFRLYTSPWS